VTSQLHQYLATNNLLPRSSWRIRKIILWSYLILDVDELSSRSFRGMVSSVLGHFGPWSFRSFFWRTEVTKEQTGSVTSVLRTELHIKRTDLHMHFGITVMLDSNNQ